MLKIKYLDRVEICNDIGFYPMTELEYIEELTRQITDVTKNSRLRT